MDAAPRVYVKHPISDQTREQLEFKVAGAVETAAISAVAFDLDDRAAVAQKERDGAAAAAAAASGVTGLEKTEEDCKE